MSCSLISTHDHPHSYNIIHPTFNPRSKPNDSLSMSLGSRIQSIQTKNDSLSMSLGSQSNPMYWGVVDQCTVRLVQISLISLDYRYLYGCLVGGRRMPQWNLESGREILLCFLSSIHLLVHSDPSIGPCVIILLLVHNIHHHYKMTVASVLFLSLLVSQPDPHSPCL